MLRTSTIATLTTALLVGLGAAALPAHAAGGGSITGSTWLDVDRDHVQDAGEAALAGKQVFLVNGLGQDVASTMTDASGRYAFLGLADGSYEVQYDVIAWWDIRADWIVDGALRPNVRTTVSVGSSQVVDLAWRPITRSRDVDHPLSSYTGPEGLRVTSYNDVVPARDVYDAVRLGLVGAEAPRTLVRFDFGATSDAATSVSQTADGRYQGFQANLNVAWLSWLDRGDGTLSHEYGHAWSLYYSFEVQQDPSMASYLRARGLDQDSRVNSAYEWSVRELIADDYRQLFGSSNARTGSPLNRQITPAPQVPGLETFLRDTFTVAGSAMPAPTTAPLSLSGPSAFPQKVKTTTDITFAVSRPATVTGLVLDGAGSTVRTFRLGQVSSSGTFRWDRTNDGGRRVRAGTYTIRVTATDGASTASGITTVQV